MPVMVTYEGAVAFQGGFDVDAAEEVERQPHYRIIGRILNLREINHPQWKHFLFTTPLYVPPRRGASRCFAINSLLCYISGEHRYRAEEVRIAVHIYPSHIAVTKIDVICKDQNLLRAFRRLRLDRPDGAEAAGPVTIVNLVDQFFPELVAQLHTRTAHGDGEQEEL